MMMTSTMILTICISMVLKRRHRGLSLDIGSRLAGSGLRGGGRSRPPPRQKFSVTSVGVIFNQWEVPPPDKSNAAVK